MAYSVGIDITKKIPFVQNNKYYVRFEAVITDLDTMITEMHQKALPVTDDINLNWIEIDALSNQVIIAYKEQLEGTE